MNGVGRYLPDAEEAQHVVDAQRVEVLLHVAQSLTEQVVHLLVFPVIGREAPVLSVHREGIGGRSCLHVEMEELRTGRGFCTLTVHANGQVTLQDDAFLAGIVGCCLQLEVQVVLDEWN